MKSKAAGPIFPGGGEMEETPPAVHQVPVATLPNPACGALVVSNMQVWTENCRKPNLQRSLLISSAFPGYEQMCHNMPLKVKHASLRC